MDSRWTTDRESPDYIIVKLFLPGAIALLSLGFLSDATGQMNASSVPSSLDIRKLRVEIVHEMKPGNGDYDVLSVMPIFQPNDGKGRGMSRSTYSPKEIFFSLDSKAITGHLIKATIGGPGGNFEGSLSESSPNSGVFTDSKHSLSLTLPAKTDLFAQKAGLFVASIDSVSLGFSNAHFSIMASGDTTRFFYIPIKTAEVTFLSSYNPGVINSVHVKVVCVELQGPNEMVVPVVENLVESAAGSKTFANPYYAGLTMTLSHLGEFDSTRSMTAIFSGEPLSYMSFSTTLTRTSPSSMTFTQAATLGQPPDYDEGIDEVPDDPDVTGNGVIRLRIKGATGPLNLIVQSDLSRLHVKALPVPGDPTTLMTGKLIIVPKDSTGNTHYKTIQTVYTASARFPGPNILISVENPTQESSPLGQGLEALYRGDFDAAISFFTAAIQLDPKSSEAYTSRGRAYEQKGDNDRAIADCDMAARLDPHDEALVANRVAGYNNRGNYEKSHGDFDKALADYSKALELDPKSYDVSRNIIGAYLDRGSSRKDKGDFQGALSDYQTALKLDSENWMTYNNLAWFWATCPQDCFRDGKKALEYANKAESMSGSPDLTILDTLAAACAEIGDFTKAVTWEAKYLEQSKLSARDAAEVKLRLALYQSHRPYREVK